MPNLSFHTLGYHHAVQFAEGFSEPAATVGYITLGKSATWDANDTAPSIIDSEYTTHDVANAAFGGKKIGGNDLSLVLPRRNWAANIVYTGYNDRANSLFASANGQYVYTAGRSVYRCLSNANSAISTVEPTGDYSIDNGFVETADGYLWKYEYAVVSSNKFITNSWIPVPTAQGIAYYGSSNNVVEGAVSQLVVVSGGTGYGNTNTTITIVGNGSGATANANVSNGILRFCEMVTVGKDYTYQNCTVTVTGSGTGANVRPVLSPHGGHAFNPALELGANTVMISTKVGESDSAEGGKISANNDFRQIGLLVGPHKYNESNPVSSANGNSAVLLASTILVTTGSIYTRDEIVYQGTDLANSTYRSVVTDYYVNDLFVTDEQGTVQLGGVLKGNTSSVNRTAVKVTPPELDPRSGQFVYIENRAAVNRATGQAENIKFVISF